MQKSENCFWNLMSCGLVGMRDTKATGDDDVSRDVLKLSREDVFQLLTQFSSNIYETGVWPKDFTEVTMIALRSQKLQNAVTIAQSASSHIQQKE
jgi:hypothetical protein